MEKALTKEKLEKVGVISHYYPKINVAIIDLNAELSVGNKILISGSTTNFRQTVVSMQIEHKNVATAGNGQNIGLKVENRVRQGDKVYKTL